MGYNFNQNLKMTNNEKEILFIKELTSNLDLEEGFLTLDTEINEIDFDSLAILSTIATLDSVFKVTISPDQLTKCKTFREILDLLN